MKKFRLFITLPLFILCSLSLFAQTNKVSGKLSGFANSYVKELQFYYDGKTQSVPIDKEQRTFSAELNLKEPQFVELKSGGTLNSFIYLFPDENFEITIDKPTLNESIIVFSQGNIQKLSKVMDRFYKTIEENDISVRTKDWARQLIGQSKILLSALDNAKAEMANNNSLIDEKVPQFKKDFTLFAETLLKYIELDNYSLKELETILEELSHSEMKLTALTVPVYRDYLVDLTTAYAARKLENYDLVLEFLKNGHISKIIAAEACVKYIPNKGVINYLFYDKISNELAANSVKHQKYLDYLFANSSKSVTDNFIKRYESLKANITGKVKDARAEAKDFEFHDVNGKLYHLADFRGKLLLLDFWASWCAPCKTQIPYMKELEKQYEGKSIVFASISLDASEPAWIKSAKEEKLHNLVLHAKKDFKNPFPIAYGITSIPRFMLIDAEGKIISDNLPKPQNKKEVTAMIDGDLYKVELNNIISKNLAAIGTQKLMSGNGLTIKAVQNFMGLEVDVETNYSFPKNLKYVFQPKENPTFKAALGQDFFKQQYLIVRKDTIMGNLRDLYKSASLWSNKLQGLEIFIASEVDKVPIDFAEENSVNTDNQFVLKATYSNRVEKYFIDKADFLIKKIIYTGNLDPRAGGGTIDGVFKYEDYKKVNGITLPHTLNLNNIITLKVLTVEVKPLDKSVFSIQ